MTTMDFHELDIAQVDCRADYDTGADRKDTWSSLPAEIKLKIIKYVPLKTRFAINRVCKQWLDLAKELNNLQTKLVVLDDSTPYVLPFDANSLCNLASHTFDSTLLMVLPRKVDGRKIIKNFPNLLAVYFADGHDRLASVFANECRFLTHLHSKTMTLSNQDRSMDWSCLYLRCNIPARHLSSLKFFKGHLYGNDHKEMMKRGLVGRSMGLLNEEKEPDSKAEILYDVDLEEKGMIVNLCRMSKLTTIYGNGDAKALARLEKLTGLIKLSWTDPDADKWTEKVLRDALMPFGHRLRSLRIHVDLNQERIMKAVIKCCPNLEELHVNKTGEDGDPESWNVNRNSYREFKMLQQLIKLKTLSIDLSDVDLKFLKMFDPETPELKSLESLTVQISAKEMIYLQFEINRKSPIAQLLMEKYERTSNFRRLFRNSKLSHIDYSKVTCPYT